jgi:inosine triphosphate pyrophosphatase
MAPRQVLFVTGNANKLREVNQILAASAADLTINSIALDLPEIQGTTQEVAAAKVKAAAEAAKGPCITEVRYQNV